MRIRRASVRFAVKYAACACESSEMLSPSASSASAKRERHRKETRSKGVRKRPRRSVAAFLPSESGRLPTNAKSPRTTMTRRSWGQRWNQASGVVQRKESSSVGLCRRRPPATGGGSIDAFPPGRPPGLPQPGADHDCQQSHGQGDHHQQQREQRAPMIEATLLCVARRFVWRCH